MNFAYRELMAVAHLGLYAHEHGLEILRHGRIKAHNGVIARPRQDPRPAWIGPAGRRTLPRPNPAERRDAPTRSGVAGGAAHGGLTDARAQSRSDRAEGL